MAYTGEDLKYLITPTAQGFNPETDDWTVEIVCGRQRIKKNGRDLKTAETEGSYLITFNSEKMLGDVICIVTANIPDTDFQSGVRKEKYVFVLDEIKRTY